MTMEPENLEGVWSIVSLEVEGHPVSAGAFSGSQIVMEGNRFTTVSMGASYGGTFTVNAVASPKELDLLFTEGPHSGKVSHAIYKLDDGCLTICLGFAGRDRPRAFATSTGSGHALETLRRETTTSEPFSTAAVELEPASGEEDLTGLQGEWAMVAGQMGGESLLEPFVATGRQFVRGNEVTVSFGGQVFLEARFTLDPSAEPKSMDFTPTSGANKGKALSGIYALSGDFLRVCYSPPGAPRPTEFSTNPGDNRTLGEWKRA